jgi:hypothetical protein
MIRIRTISCKNCSGNCLIPSLNKQKRTVFIRKCIPKNKLGSFYIDCDDSAHIVTYNNKQWKYARNIDTHGPNDPIIKINSRNIFVLIKKLKEEYHYDLDAHPTIFTLIAATILLKCLIK